MPGKDKVGMETRVPAKKRPIQPPFPGLSKHAPNAWFMRITVIRSYSKPRHLERTKSQGSWSLIPSPEKTQHTHVYIYR